MGVSFFFVGMLSAFLAIVAMPMPLGLPPLPEDPTLLRVAPKDSVVFVEWFGTARPNPQSRNATERLAAEPEVQTLVQRAIDELHEMAAREAGRGEAAEVTAVLDLGQAILSRPGCFFVASFDPRQGDAEIGIVVHLGPDKDRVAKLLRRVEAAWLDNVSGFVDPQQASLVVEGVSFRSVPMPAGGPALSWTIEGDHLAFAVGEDTPRAIVDGLRGTSNGLADNENFTTAHGEVATARPSFRSFIDLKQLIGLLQPELGARENAVMTALGLMDLRALLTESGLEGGGYVQRTSLSLDKRRGLFGMVDGRPLEPADLKIVPGDATLATVARFAPQRAYRQLLDLIGKFDENALPAFRAEVLEPFRTVLGVDLEKDLIAHVGDTVALWNSPGQGGFVFSGLTLAVSLKDPQAFRQSFDTATTRLAELAKKDRSGRRLRRDVYVDRTEFAGRTIWFLDTMDDDIPFAPAWCTSDTHLLVSLFPQMLKDTLRRDGASLADDADAAPDGALILGRTDTANLFRQLYPALLPLAQVVFTESQREGYGLTVADLPTAAAIQPHLRREVSRMRTTDHGFLLTRTGTFPWADPMIGFAFPVLAVMPMLFFYRTGRAVRRAQVLRVEAERAAVEAQKEAERRKKENENRKRDDD